MGRGNPAPCKFIMSNGNTEVLREMRAIIKEGKSVDVDTRDRLLFTAMIDIYETLESMRPAMMSYRIGLWLVSAIIVAMVGMYFK